MSYWPFVRLAKKAEANYPIRKTAIVDLNILDEFFRRQSGCCIRIKEEKGEALWEITEARFRIWKSLSKEDVRNLSVIAE